MKSAMELANAVTEVGVSNATGDYGETPDQVREYTHELGLGPFLDKGRDSAAICETETRPRYTERARALLTDWGMKGAYNIYSGTAHAELYAVVRSFEKGAAAAGSEPILRLASNPILLHAAVHAALLAMIAPLERVGLLFGWHGDAGPGAELSKTIDYINLLMTGLAPAP